jgi:hypothetical protein
LWLASLLVCAGLTAANLYFGDLNQDEGWYLYAARLVGEGKVPYRDFAFTQGPVLPYVYAAAQPLIGSAGVLGGRILTALFGLGAALLAAGLAARLARPGRRGFAALVAFSLVALNAYQSYFSTVVKTYALCAFLLTAGFFALSMVSHPAGRLYSMAGGILLALAAGTRISAGAALPAVFFVLLACDRNGKEKTLAGSSISGAHAWFFAAGAALTCCAIFLPFMAAAPGNFFFWLTNYHSGRETGGAVQQLIFKAGFVSRVVQAYFVAMALGIAALAWRLLPDGAKEGEAAMAAGPGRPVVPMLWISAAAITLVHFLAPFPYDDYEAAVFPLFAAAISFAVVNPRRTGHEALWLAAVVFAVSVAGSLSSPVNQAWVVKERDRIWWRMKEEPSLTKLRRVGRLLHELAGENGKILTQDTYVAVEAGLRVPEGLELGPFSYYPEWDARTAARRHVMNRDMLQDLLKNCDADIAAFSGYGLAIASPQVTELPASERSKLWQTVLERYKVVVEVPCFGQALTPLKILTRKTEPGK